MTLTNRFPLLQKTERRDFFRTSFFCASCAIAKRLASDYQAARVRTQEVFDKACEHTEPSHWIWDGVHPLPQGHELIARSWIETVQQQLKD